MNRTTTSMIGTAMAMLALAPNAHAQQNKLVHGSTAVHSRDGMPSIHFTATDRGNAPANDDCANATSIAVTPDCSSPTGGDNTNATESEADPSCDGPSTGIFADVYYTFNSGANTSVEVTLTPDANMTDWVLVILDGCGGTEVLCIIQPDGAQVVPVAANTDYIARVYSNTEYGTPGTFTLCVAGGAPPPVNDACDGTTPQDLAIGNSLTFTGTTAGATADGDFAQTDLGLPPAVWHAFTVTDACADVTVSFCGTDPSVLNYYAVLSPACPLDTTTAIFSASDNVAECADGNPTIHYYGLAAGTYYMPVLSASGQSYGPYTIAVSAATCAPPPANDDCAGAIALTSGSTCVPVSGTTLLATESLPADSCNGYLGAANDDVWYSFTATTSDMTIAVQGDGDFDAVVELFEGTCGAFTEIDCADATVGGETEEIQHTGFNVGQTYYVRLFNYSDLAPSLSSFNICASEGLGTSLGAGTLHQAPIAWSVFPNPTSGELYVAYGDSPGRASLDVMDMSGRTVHSELIMLASGSQVHLNLSNKLAAGTYSVRITTSAGTNSQRVIVR